MKNLYEFIGEYKSDRNNDAGEFLIQLNTKNKTKAYEVAKKNLHWTFDIKIHDAKLVDKEFETEFQFLK